MRLLGTNTPGQSGSKSNDDKTVLHIPKILRTGSTPSDAVQYHTQNTTFSCGRGLTHLQGIQTA